MRGVQYESREAAARARQSDSIPFFAGFALGIDIVAPIMKAVGSYGGYEASLRANIRQKWFPVAELGYGTCDHTNETSHLHYKTSAPYFRIGADYNFNKDLLSGNRIYGGLRLAGTVFKYDLDGPPITDEIWGQSVDFSFAGVSSSAAWAELVFGLEAKIWKNFHIGWSARYKRRIYQKKTDAGAAWYIPGYGRNDSHTFGATFHLIFDI